MPPKSKSEPRFRPVLSATELAYIESLVKQDYLANSSPTALPILSKITPLMVKISLGTANPAYSTTPKLSLEESLGFSIPEESPGEAKEKYWAACYTKLTEQGVDSCTPAEIAAAKEHMYLNDLMSPEEEAAFEASLGRIYK